MKTLEGSKGVGVLAEFERSFLLHRHFIKQTKKQICLFKNTLRLIMMFVF